MAYDLTPELPNWRTDRVGQGVLLEGGKVLLAGNRWYSDKPLVWTLPGGRAEDGEGVEEALVREFREETGLSVEVTGLAFVVEARSLLRKRLFLSCAFEVRRVSGALNCEADPDVEELRFVPPQELGVYLPSPSLGEPLQWYLAHPGEGARYWFFPEYSSG